MADEVKPEAELTPLERVGRATLGKPKTALCAVRAVDVLAVCLSIPPAKETEVTRAQGRGSAIAVRGMAPGAAEDVTVYAAARDLREVLEVAAGGNAQ